MGEADKSARTWREFEQLVARLEADCGPLGLTVKSPDRLPCKVTGRVREVDASIRSKVGSSEVLITMECRKRRPRQDVTWIEQLATKRANLGVDRTIAVSSSGFSPEAEVMARHYGIALRRLSEVSAVDLNRLMCLDFVLFNHKNCAIACVGIRLFKSTEWELPQPEQVDFVLPPGTDPFAPIFKSMITGNSWSLNDLWKDLQSATDPFYGIEKRASPVVKTACFPYCGDVTVDTPEGAKRIGDVLLSVALWLEVEQVTLESASRVEYVSPDGLSIQRVEFGSRKSGLEDWRISLQIPRDSTDLRDLRTGVTGPERKSSS